MHMRIQKLNSDTKKNLLEDLLKRSPNNYGQYEASVKEILDKVKEEKDAAVFAYTAKFDGAELTADTIEVTDAEIEEAYAQVDDTLLTVIRKAKDNSKVIMQNSVRTAGLTVNRTEPFLGRRSLRFTESACMCREERQFIRLRY